MSASITMLAQIRTLIYKAIVDLNDDQFLTIPAGFDNNIAWNLGHIITTQQRLSYGICGREMYLSDEMMSNYLPGTSPSDWTETPDKAKLLDMLQAHPQKLAEDFKDAQFAANFQERRTKTGLHLATIEDALIFNNYHEGLHFGTIQSLRNFVV